MYGVNKVLIWLKFIAAFLQPPGLNVLLCVLGIYYWLRSAAWMAAFFLISSTILLYLSSIPIISDQLLAKLEGQYPQSKIAELVNQKEPKAIVVLLSEADPNYALNFNQYAAQIAKAAQLPILVSGSNSTNDAAFMAKSLATDFNITGAIWVEGSGYTTRESSKLAKQVLDQNAIKNIFLITNAWHMSRAIQNFKSLGLEVVPVPIPTTATISKSNKIENFIPSSKCLLHSELFFHEYLENLWSKIFNHG